MDNKIKWRLIEVREIEEVGPNLTPKRDVVVEWGEWEYPSAIVVTFFWQEKSELIDKSDTGKEATIFVNFKVSKTKDWRVFNNINAWKVVLKEPDFVEEDNDLPF